LNHGDGKEQDAVMFLTLNSHHVTAGFDAALAKEGGQRLEQTLGDEVAIGYEFFEFLNEFVVQV
jgi:hypothetical protein